MSAYPPPRPEQGPAAHPSGLPAPVPAPVPRNPAGRISLILGIVLVGVVILRNLLSLLIPLIAYRAQLGTGAIGGLLAISTVIVMLIGAAAAIIGFIGLQRPGLPRGAAGAGAALGTAAVVEGLFGLASGPIVSLLG